MRSLVLFESFYGNTEQIALSVGAVLGNAGEVRIRRLSEIDAADLAAVDLLVAGTPTRRFGPGEGTRSWMKTLAPGSLAGKKAVVFDTRLDAQRSKSWLLKGLAKLFGYGAEPLAKALQTAGAVVLLPTAGFFVDGMEGPLTAGEELRAQEWISGIVKKF